MVHSRCAFGLKVTGRSTRRHQNGVEVSTANKTYAEVVEHIRAAIADHAQAQDDGRTDDLVALYCPDGVVEVPDVGTYEGRDAIRDAFSGWTPKLPQRHVISNTLVTDWNDHEAKAVSDVVFIQKGESGWAVQVVARYHDTFQQTDGVWLFRRRMSRYATSD